MEGTPTISSSEDETGVKLIIISSSNKNSFKNCFVTNVESIQGVREGEVRSGDSGFELSRLGENTVLKIML